MVCFLTKNPNLGKFWRVLEWKMLEHFMAIWSVLRPWVSFWAFGKIYGNLVYIFPVLVCFTRQILATHQQKSETFFGRQQCDQKCLERAIGVLKHRQIFSLAYDFFRQIEYLTNQYQCFAHI
jgi:hypothetical protein